ncbi:MAG: Holliday junction resolvase RuvX [Actinomycetota bacterium]
MILGIDVGTHRVGIAAAHEETKIAHPVEVIVVAERDPVARISELVIELEASSVVVGRPTALSGESGPAVEAQADFVARLRAALEVEVFEYDERLTTVMANQGMRAAGADRSAQKSLRDAIAAQVMLQGYLDSSR